MKKYSKFLLAMLMAGNINMRSLSEQEKLEVVGSVHYLADSSTNTITEFHKSLNYSALWIMLDKMGANVLFMSDDEFKEKLESVTRVLNSCFHFNSLKENGAKKTMAEAYEEIQETYKKIQQQIKTDQIPSFNGLFRPDETNRSFVCETRTSKDNKVFYEIKDGFNVKFSGYLDLNNLDEHEFSVKHENNSCQIQFWLKVGKNGENNRTVRVKMNLLGNHKGKTNNDLISEITNSPYSNYKLCFYYGNFYYNHNVGSLTSNLFCPRYPSSEVQSFKSFKYYNLFLNFSSTNMNKYNVSAESRITPRMTGKYSWVPSVLKITMPYEKWTVTEGAQNNSFINNNGITESVSRIVDNSDSQPLTVGNKVEYQETLFNLLEQDVPQSVNVPARPHNMESKKLFKPFQSENKALDAISNLKKRVKNSKEKELTDKIYATEKELEKIKSMPNGKKKEDLTKNLKKKLDQLGDKINKINPQENVAQLEQILSRLEGLRTPTIALKGQELSKLVYQVQFAHLKIDYMRRELEKLNNVSQNYNSNGQSLGNPISNNEPTTVHGATLSQRPMKTNNTKCKCFGCS